MEGIGRAGRGAEKGRVRTEASTVKKNFESQLSLYQPRVTYKLLNFSESFFTYK